MKKLREKIPFIFLIMFMFAISAFSFSGIFNITSNATSLSDISTNQISASFTFNGNTQDSNPSFTEDYTASDYTLSLSVEDAESYKWYFASNDDYSELTEQTSNSINIRNCNQSGNYVCAVTTSDGVKVTEPVSITINPKLVTLTNFAVENKEYDGTTRVNVTAECFGIIDCEIDDVIVTIIGNTTSPNADTKKFVNITDITFSSSNGSNYIANENSLSDNLFVDITKKTVTLIWETLDNKEAYDYNGTDQIGNISVYYYGLQNIKTHLSFAISGYNGSYNFYNEFKNAGYYTATAILTDKEVNFEITNPTKRLDIKKVNPIVTIDNSPFTYNGREQDAADRVTINNSEQVLNFVNNKFTSCLEGEGKEVTVSASESMNYMSFSRKFKIQVLKGTAKLDVTGVNRNFVYNGTTQVINSGAVIDNTEQIIKYSNNTFETVLQGNGLEVSVFAEATDNYNYVSESFTISVEKATLDTSLWRWNYVNPYIYSVGTERVLRVDYYPENIVMAIYTQERATNVGLYVATVRFELIDKDNYNEVGEFPSMPWRINKQTVTIPVLNNVTTTYNGESQTLSNLSSNLLYTVKGNEQKNAGSYPVTISLNEPNNFEWDNGNSNDLVINWIIDKAKVEKPAFDLDDFDGTAESIGISEDAPYELIYSDDKFILLGLKDGDNYTWESTTRPYLRIDLAGGFFDGPALPIFVITLTLITLILIAVYFAVHSTIIIKRHHKKVALIKARKLKKQLVLVTGENLPQNTNFTVEKETSKEETNYSEEYLQETEVEPAREENIKEIQEENIQIKETKVSVNEVSKNNEVENLEELSGVIKEEPEIEKIVKPRGKRKSTAKKETGEKTRKPYAKSRKIESKKKVAQKKKEMNAKKLAAQKEAEKKKLANKKAKEKAKKQESKTAKKTTTKGTTKSAAKPKTSTANLSEKSKTTTKADKKTTSVKAPNKQKITKLKVEDKPIVTSSKKTSKTDNTKTK